MALVAVVSALLACHGPLTAETLKNPASAGSAQDVLDLSPGEGVEMRLARLPAGVFLMGSPAAKPEVLPKQREVKIDRPFYIGMQEVTRGHFKCFVRHAAYFTLAEKAGRVYVWQGTYSSAIRQGVSWRNSGFEQDDEHPVVLVSWSDAVAFCEWLSRKSGLHVRLPTEAEWEYACRAGTNTPYHTGEKLTPDPAHYEAFIPASRESHRNLGTVKVGKFKPNPWGLHDMHGNAPEWCSDEAKHRGFSLKMDEPEKFGSDVPHVVRGGSWRCPDWICRSACRQVRPGALGPCLPYNSAGFRVLLESQRRQRNLTPKGGRAGNRIESGDE